MVTNHPTPARVSPSRLVFPTETSSVVDMEWIEKNAPVGTVTREWMMKHPPHGTDIEWIKKKSKQFSAHGQESVLDYYRRKYGDPIPSRQGEGKERVDVVVDKYTGEGPESNAGRERVFVRSRLGTGRMVGVVPGAGAIRGEQGPWLELPEPVRELDPFYTGTTADALNKTVARPATKFEELFKVYPVLQTIFKNFSTREVLKLCLTSVHLCRIIKGSIHVFSNHRTPYTGIILNATESTYKNIMYDFFSQQGELDRFLFSDIVDWSTIKHLVLDMTPLKLKILAAIAERSSLITLSVKYSTNLTLDDIQVLLDPENSRRYDTLYNTHLPNYNQSSQQLGPRKGLLPDLERLCVRTCRVFYPQFMIY
ncbi:uncharacterized protein LAJ45_07125 [Morchella importuna]|uniref:uncharacterized protein n=1 Tax=Morchella importuna TaxID=1174673 RepID=UPI001E8CA040|nr:uncharacterized protein LAJ45_07125 [Morchella importuna]KAH8148782.1 hypothetical protein LAJ45_07125 [Morchella importuna]